MFRTMLKSKIHRACVTQADLHYVGSLALSRDLMEAADLLPGERVDIANLSNGSRMSTYLIEAPAGSGVVGVNGASARIIAVGDLVIILGYGMYSMDEVSRLRPRVVHVDGRNRIVGRSADAAEPVPGSDTVSGAEVHVD
ncbi:aspartate 1-decarboxylase [Streptomyces sp. NPDC029674]|uniref:aspartate 1-decarboxylase n=1 Tax=Streptomyces sp. NPDC029674 TaxID=3365297 RepID=UPI00384A9C82